MKVGNVQAAEYLGIHHTTLSMWRSIGRPHIPYYKLGGKVVYDTDDLEVYLEKHRIDSPAEGGNHAP